MSDMIQGAEALKEFTISDADMQWYLQNGIVAVAFDKEGEYYDGCYNWESAQNLANSGYRLIAIANDGNMEKEEIQRICNYELACAIDCFGQDHLK